MKAIHRNPGPRGFAVFGDDGSLLAEHLTQEAAWRLIRQDIPPDNTVEKGAGFSSSHWPYSLGLIDRVDACSHYQYCIEQKKKNARWFAHWQGVGYS